MSARQTQENHLQPGARVVIVHGSYGSPERNWFPWLKQQIETMGSTALVPKFPTPDGQNLTAWAEAFRSEAGALTPETILVGHSLGAGFVLNLLQESPVQIRAAFLIAGFLGTLGLPDYDRINATFVCREFNWPLIKQKAGTIIVMNGDDDPYVPVAKGRALADALAVSLHVVPGGGHLNAECGYISFPLLESTIRPFLTSNFAQPFPT